MQKLNTLSLKKTLLFVLIGLGLSNITNAQENSSISKNDWVLKAGVGFSSAEFMKNGFASGFSVGKRLLDDVLEVGISFNHSTQMNKEFSTTHSNATGGAPTLILVDMYTDSPYEKHEAGSLSDTKAYAGFSPVKLIWEDSRHDFLIAANYGVATRQHVYIYSPNNNSQTDIITRSHVRFSWGAQAAYEYRFNKTLAAGLTAFYDNQNEDISALATLNVHF